MVKRALLTLFTIIYLVGFTPCDETVILAGMELIFFTVPVFWICAGKCFDSTRMFSFLLSIKHFSLSIKASLHLCPPHHQEGWGHTKGWEGHSQDSWLRLTQCIFHTIWFHAQNIELGKEEGGAWSEWWSLFSQVVDTHDGFPCSPGDGWTSFCPWEVVN